MQQLPSARGDRTMHFQNLNHYQDGGYAAHLMRGKFWQIDEATYNEFLEMLPPRYVPGGFSMIEKLTDDITATYLTIGGDFWCAYTDDLITSPRYALNHISREVYGR